MTVTTTKLEQVPHAHDRQPAVGLNLDLAWQRSRQAEILALAAQGYANAEIGERLHVSEDTVKTHMRRVMRLLGARNRTHCVHIAHRLGIAVVTAADLNIRHRPTVQVAAALSPPEPSGRRPVAGPARPPATHWLQVDDRVRPDRSLRVDIRTTHEQALIRLSRLADMTYPPGRVHLLAADGVTVQASLPGRRTDSTPPQHHRTPHERRPR